MLMRRDARWEAEREAGRSKQVQIELGASQVKTGVFVTGGLFMYFEPAAVCVAHAGAEAPDGSVFSFSLRKI